MGPPHPHPKPRGGFISFLAPEDRGGGRVCIIPDFRNGRYKGYALEEDSY